MDSSLIGLVSASTALVASILGPAVSLAVARRQINASVLSANREKWIETLRTMIAELISLLVAVVVIKSDWKGTWARGHGAIAANPELLQKLERMVLVQWQIRLLIDAADPEHIEGRNVSTAVPMQTHAGGCFDRTDDRSSRFSL